jgi:hypothetical protein
MDGLLMLFISAFTPFLLEKLKWARWFPLMQPVAPVLNRLTPLVLSAIVAAGIVFNFNSVTGVLTISGLIPSDVIRGLLLWGGGALVQQLSYQRAIKVGS